MLKLVKLKENTELNIVNKIIDFKNPSRIYIPIITQKTFKMNDYIYKNTYFDNFIASVSGYVKGSRSVLVNNRLIPALEIENDFKENINVKKRKKKVNTKEELLKTLDEYNLKNIIEKIKGIGNINNLVISSIDEEEYSIKEFLRLANNYRDILDTTDYLRELFKVKNTILATKSTNFKSIKNVKSIIGTYPSIKINLVPDKYLISYKDFLCEYLNISKEESLVLTTNEVYCIYNILSGKDITENLITISGNALEKSLVLNVRLNTSLKEIVNEFLNITTDQYDIYINGYLKGIKKNNIEEIIITKNIHSIIINKKLMVEETECINCGACQKICPFNINVKNNYFNKYSHKNCIGCGLCNYICPANIKLKEIVMGDNNEEL